MSLIQIVVGTIACRVKEQACRDEAFELLEQLITVFERDLVHPVASESLVRLSHLYFHPLTVLIRGKTVFVEGSLEKEQRSV